MKPDWELNFKTKKDEIAFKIQLIKNIERLKDNNQIISNWDERGVIFKENQIKRGIKR